MVEEMKVEEGKEKRRKVKVVTVNLSVSVAVQTVTWLINVPYISQDHHLSAGTVTWITKPLSARLPNATRTIQR